MNNIFHGNKITLRPATIEDRRQVYEWLALSDITSSMLGAPHFPDNPPPTWEEFTDDYAPYFFDGSEPARGRCFIIQLNDEDIGQINYNEIYNHETELDTWLAAAKYTGKGYGTDAVNSLCNYLHDVFQLKRCYIAPSARNNAAIKAYQKAGFVDTADYPSWFLPDYEDTVVMMREWQ